MTEPKERISKKGTTIFLFIQLGILIVTVFTLIYYKEYGWWLFCIIPASVGMTVGVYTNTFNTNKVLKGTAIVTGILILLSLIMIFMGSEGAICVAMALGIIIIPGILGIFAGYGIRNKFKYLGIGIIFILNSSAYVYDKNDNTIVKSVAIEEVIIHAEKSKVWEVLTEPVEFGEPENRFLKIGVSYPTNMQLQTIDEILYLKCELNNGSARLKIERLDSLSKMRFTMPETIETMRRISVLPSYDKEHMKGFFNPNYGEFELEEMDDGTTKLIARTSYSYKITPAFYWRWWSDFLINAMHRNVLDQIKLASEKEVST